MPIIRVSCLPKMSEKKLRSLFEDIMLAVESSRGLYIEKGEGKNLFTVLFPPDSMAFGLGLDVVIEVIGLEELVDTTAATREQLSLRLNNAVAQHCPAKVTKKVRCFVFPWDINSSEYSSLNVDSRRTAMRRRRRKAVAEDFSGFPKKR